MKNHKRLRESNFFCHATSTNGTSSPDKVVEAKNLLDTALTYAPIPRPTINLLSSRRQHWKTMTEQEIADTVISLEPSTSPIHEAMFDGKKSEQIAKVHGIKLLRHQFTASENRIYVAFLHKFKACHGISHGDLADYVKHNKDFWSILGRTTPTSLIFKRQTFPRVQFLRSTLASHASSIQQISWEDGVRRTWLALSLLSVNLDTAGPKSVASLGGLNMLVIWGGGIIAYLVITRRKQLVTLKNRLWCPK